MIRVYTKPNCQQCNATIRWLNNNNVKFETEPITENVREAAIALGITSAPIVAVGEVQWGGFDPGKLAEYAL